MFGGRGTYRITAGVPASSRLIDQAGKAVSGFTYSTLSNTFFDIAGGLQILHPVPEPFGYAISVMGLVFILVLSTLKRSSLP